MAGRTQSLSGKNEFTRVMRAKQRMYAKSMSISYMANQLALARLGMTVPKRLVPKAVARNRIKRQLRSRFRRRESMLDGFDVIASVRIACTDLSSARSFADEFAGLLDQLIQRRART